MRKSLALNPNYVLFASRFKKVPSKTSLVYYVALNYAKRILERILPELDTFDAAEVWTKTYCNRSADFWAQGLYYFDFVFVVKEVQYNVRINLYNYGRQMRLFKLRSGEIFRKTASDSRLQQLGHLDLPDKFKNNDPDSAKMPLNFVSVTNM